MYLEEVIEWDPEEDKVCEVLKDVKGAVDYPVSQPLLVIITLRGLNCFEAEGEGLEGRGGEGLDGGDGVRWGRGWVRTRGG